MSGIIDATSYLQDPSNYEFNAPGASFWMLVLISLFLIPIQTSFEELLFRSYMLQGLGMWKPYRIIPFLVTSILFGLMHIMNPEVGEYGYIVMSHYIGTGLLLGALVMLSDSMEFSLGMHAANNIYGSVLVGFKSSALTTDSLFYCKEMKVDIPTTLFSLLLMFIYGVIIWKKYKLKPISYLFSKVEPSKINK
jgi:membrane protease YdiL (CAAX protease family)